VAKRRIKGSPPGKLSWSEWFYALVKPWAWHVGAAFLLFLGFAADYAHANLGWFETKYGGWGASVIAGLTGLIRSYQIRKVLKAKDTQEEE